MIYYWYLTDIYHGREDAEKGIPPYLQSRLQLSTMLGIKRYAHTRCSDTLSLHMHVGTLQCVSEYQVTTINTLILRRAQISFHHHCDQIGPQSMCSMCSMCGWFIFCSWGLLLKVYHCKCSMAEEASQKTHLLGTILPVSKRASLAQIC